MSAPMKVGLFVMGTRDGSYEDFLRQVERAEGLGFYRAALAERHFRHQTLLLASPLAFAAAIAARTRRIRIGVFGRVLSLDHPLRVAESAATVDVLSGGRLDFGATRASLDEECHRVFESPMDQSESRFDEALCVILRAWTADAFAHQGPHYRFPPLAVFPRPLQQPHPPVFIVAVSDQRLAYAARCGYHAVIGALRPATEVASARKRFESERAAVGLTPTGAELQVNRFVHVAETDQLAREQLRDPFEAFIERHAPDLRAALESAHGGVLPGFERMVEEFLVVGSPETVTARLIELRDVAGISSLLATLNFVTLDHAACSRSMDLFGDEVMPALTTL
jgi:alkanesulfonate monooxygenase SsuD/methylene tetrahydromethanopterin reductase-like flavin-dependent oxidoreductase (luciferase family)